jgi:long-chain acyl-CoA synthetase
MGISIEDILAKKAEITGEGGFFELEDREVDGFTYKVHKHAPRTSIDLIQNARGHGDAEFIVYEGRRYTYEEFYAAVDALAAALQARGVEKGDRVAIAMRNNPEWAIGFAAATLIGAIVVPINSWGKTQELSFAISDSGSKTVICDPARFRLIESSLGDLDIDVIVALGAEDLAAVERVESFDAVLESGRGQDYQLVDADPLDQCLILYTSGSTGFPKGVVHRHIAVSQALFSMMYSGMLVMSLEGPRELKAGATVETPLLTVPLFHATGLLSGFHLPLFTGQKVVMMYKWDTIKALELIQEEKVTSFSSVPAIVQDLLANPEFDNYNTESLIRVTGAGAATPTGLPELIQEKCGNPSRSAGYGMTETLAMGGIMSGCIYDLKPNASGLVVPTMELRMVDQDGNVLPPGEPGEIEFYGICCTPGYWQKPEANASTFDEGRWMKSGDIGYVDDEGFIHITGRMKEIVIRGGENIYPGEIEAAAYELDQVHECVVFGAPDAAMGEELVMVVFLTPGTSLSEDELRAFLKERLAAYKVPKTIRFAGEPLPRNASEKLHKLKVKEAYLAG